MSIRSAWVRTFLAFSAFTHIPLLLAQAEAPTTTYLTVTSNGSPVSTANFGDVVTLTATVASGGGPVAPGQVKFCDMLTSQTAACSDVHLIGTSQLLSNGTATIKTRPGTGAHAYKAVFLGTRSKAMSASATTDVSVTGSQVSATTINIGVGTEAAQLTASVSVFGTNAAPGGTVTLADSSNSNVSLGTATLDPLQAKVSFRSLATLPVIRPPFYSMALAVADLNLDGIQDIVEITENATFGSAFYSIYLGNPDGTFKAISQSISMPGVWRPTAISVGDYNMDGLSDFSVSSSGAGYNICLGRGDGTFNVRGVSPSTFNARTLLTADVNLDGIPDLVGSATLGTKISSGTLQTLLGKGDGTFSSGPTTPMDGTSFEFATDLAMGDFNGDGIPDFAGTLETPAEVNVFLGNGDGTFSVHQYGRTDWQNPKATIADFDGDGNADLLVHAGTLLTVLFGDGTGNLVDRNVQTDVGSYPTVMLVLDLNGDGVPDIVSSGSVWAGSGTGTFIVQPPIPYPMNTGYFGDPVGGQFRPGQNGVLFPSQIVGVAGLTSTFSQSIAVAPNTLQVTASYSGDDVYSSSSGLTALPAAMPSISPTMGTFTSMQKITISDIWSPTAVIHYTTDGSTPGETSPSYFQPLTLTKPGTYTIKAAAHEKGALYSSAFNQVTVTIAPTALPVITPSTGIFDYVHTVAITDSTPGAVIHYTLDGSNPTIHSPSYFQPITLSPGTWTIKAMAHVLWMDPSPIVQATITVNPVAAPLFPLEGGVYAHPQMVPITNVTPNSVIHYTIDGSTPTISSPVYMGPIRVQSGVVTIKAIAHIKNTQPSAVASQTYSIIHF